MRVIRRFARTVAEMFQPEKIILFGSHAYGTPHDDSDVDILVVVPARSRLRMAARIENAVDPPFPLDVIVRTPRDMKWRLEEHESFLTEITTRGKLLYEKNDAGVAEKSRAEKAASSPVSFATPRDLHR
jgi:predicted nucleotidyltransferase